MPLLKCAKNFGSIFDSKLLFDKLVTSVFTISYWELETLCFLILSEN